MGSSKPGFHANRQLLATCADAEPIGSAPSPTPGAGDSRAASGRCAPEWHPSHLKFSRPGKYKVIVVDPPWNQGKTGRRRGRPNQGTQLDYPTMTKAQLLELPIREIAEEQSYLWLWATNSKDRTTGEPILKMAFELMANWGSTFYTLLT